MNESKEIKRKIERAALAGLSAASMDASERSTDISMEELAALVETAGGEAVGAMVRQRQHLLPLGVRGQHHGAVPGEAGRL